MKIQLIRSVGASLIGLLLVLWPDVALQYLVIAIGALFFVPALWSVIRYFTRPSAERPLFPMAPVGSALFGFLLMIAPSFFVSIFMLLFGALLTYLGLSMIISLVAAHRWSSFSWMFFLAPVVLTAIGIIVLVDPFGSASVSFLLLGIGILAYGVIDLVYNYFFKLRRQESAFISKVTDVHDAESAEEIPNVEDAEIVSDEGEASVDDDRQPKE